MQSRRLFVACAPDFIRRAAIRALVFLRLPAQAERDVEAALGRVSPSSQVFLIGAAQDGGVPDEQAVERLACLWVAASSVNLTDDIADGDCDYLPARVAPGVGFLLQSLAMSLAIRGGSRRLRWASTPSLSVGRRPVRAWRCGPISGRRSHTSRWPS